MGAQDSSFGKVCHWIAAIFLPMNFVLWFLFLFVFRAYGMEPLALLATQGHWQAAQPIVVNVDYDVPAFGTTDEIEDLRKASAVEYTTAKRQKLLAKALSAKAVEIGNPVRP